MEWLKKSTTARNKINKTQPAIQTVAYWWEVGEVRRKSCDLITCFAWGLCQQGQQQQQWHQWVTYRIAACAIRLVYLTSINVGEGQDTLKVTCWKTCFYWSLSHAVTAWCMIPDSTSTITLSQKKHSSCHELQYFDKHGYTDAKYWSPLRLPPTVTIPPFSVSIPPPPQGSPVYSVYMNFGSDPGIDSTSDRNEYQEYLLGLEAAGA